MSALFSGLGPIFLLGGLSIILIALGVSLYSQQRRDPFGRIATMKGGARGDAAAAAVAPGGLRHESHEQKLKKFSGFLEPKDASQLSEMRKHLMRAGYHGRDAIRVYHAVQMIAGLVGLALGVFYVVMQQANGADISTNMMAIWVLGPGLIGYMAPKRYVNRRVEAREKEIISGFPDSLDLLLVCMEAGQSLNQSILRVSEEMRSSYPALSLEYETVAHQLRAGMERAMVFREMADRCNVDDITSFTTVLIQSQTFGTSISDALRVYSAEMRDKRIMRAEEKANTLPTKMTLATMMFTIPPLLIVLLGPSVYRIMQAFGGG